MVFDFEARSKFENRFTGPAMITAVKDEGLVFDVKFLGTKIQKTLHSRCLRFFDHARMVVTPELLRQSEWFAKRKWDVEHLLDIRFVVDQWQVQVLWASGEDSWELADKLSEDIPDMFEEFIQTGFPARATARRDNYLRERNSHRGTVESGAVPTGPVHAPVPRRRGRPRQ
jgi:hypothetical protein